MSLLGVLVRLKRYDEANEVFDRAKSNEVDGDKLKHLSEKLQHFQVEQDFFQEKLQEIILSYNAGKYQQAIEEARKIIEQNPDEGVLHNIVGASCASLGRYDEAIESYKYAIKINPSDPELYNNLGVALKQTGNLEEALSNYQEAIRINPTYAEAHNNIGNYFQDKSNFHVAIKSYQKALEINPNYFKAHYNLGMALKANGDNSGAVDSYTRALNINPSFAEGHNNIGSCLLDLGRVDDAVESYDRAISLKPAEQDYVENVYPIIIQVNSFSPDNISSFESDCINFNKFLTSCPRLQIQAAIAAFIKQDIEAVKKILRMYKSSEPSNLKKMHKKNQEFCNAYNNYLSKLIKGDFLKNEDATDIFYHVGESHCLSFAHQILVFGFRFSVVWLGSGLELGALAETDIHWRVRVRCGRCIRKDFAIGKPFHVPLA